MLYMLLAGSAPMAGGQGLRTSMGGASVPAVAAGHFPIVAVALALMLFGDVVLTTDRLTCAARWATAPTRSFGVDAAVSPRRAHSADRPALAPRLAACCKIATAVTMGYMLILTL
jgi:hypothetical protein